MELIMEIVKLVALLVWIAFGGLSIGLGLMYYKVTRPMIRPMSNMYKEMWGEVEENKENKEA